MIMGAHFGAFDISHLPGWEWFAPTLRTGNVAFIGVRNVWRKERVILEALGAHVSTRYTIDKKGIGEVLKDAMNAVNPFYNKPIHLHFDIDACDPQVAPSTAYNLPGGLTYREGRFICEFLSQTKLLTSMDLAEINPNILQGKL